eukprot:gene52481-35860_t
MAEKDDVWDKKIKDGTTEQVHTVDCCMRFLWQKKDE